MSDGDLLRDWLTEEQLAAQLRHCEQTLRRWRKRGVGPRFTQNGRGILYHHEDVTSWLRAGGINAAATKAQPRRRARAR
jgi:Helix-turn-helix domain